MALSVGTFNLNNLFSRFNFNAEITSLAQLEKGIFFKSTAKKENNELFSVRTYQGRLVKKKDPEDIAIIAERIKRTNIDILAVQEVEDKDTLREFNAMVLDNLYPYVGVIEGNDARLIDVGIMSKYPIGDITSWQFATHPTNPNQPVFSRDVLEVTILNTSRTEVLFKIYNNHLKSNFVDFRRDKEAGRRMNNATRKKQSEILAKIIRQGTKNGEDYIILGDMNDAIDADSLIPFIKDPARMLVNGLGNPTETQPFKETVTNIAWTYRFKKSNKAPIYTLFDQIWLSPNLAKKQQGAFIDRRTLLSGDGTDHDLAWVVLNV